MKGLLLTPLLAWQVCHDAKFMTRRVLGIYPELDLKSPDVQAKLLAKCGYIVGERRALLTTWAVAKEYDGFVPRDLPAGRVARNFWHAGLGPKPEGFGRCRHGRFLPNVLRGVCMPMLDFNALKVERIQDITEREARAEGVRRGIVRTKKSGKEWVDYDIPDHDDARVTYREPFRLLWNRINGRRGFPWDKNPVVIVIEFKKL